MTRRGVAALALAAAAWVATAPAGAQERDFPRFTAPVVDDARVVDDALERSLNAALIDYQERSTNQIAVAVVGSTGNASIEDYANDLFDEWEPGTEKDDNGVLLVIAVEDRELRIEVGGGLEGDLTDVESKRIIDDHMVPRLRAGDYGAAVQVGTQEIRRALGDDRVGAAPPTSAPDGDGSAGGWVPLLLGGGFLLSMLGGGFGVNRRRRSWGLGAPIIWGGGFGGGGGGFGGGGGGGFGGGGGGGSFGGGASGGW